MYSKLRMYCISAILLVTIISILLLAGCGTSNNNAALKYKSQAIPVQTVVVKTGDLSSVNNLSGVVASDIQTNIGAKLAGHVQSVNVDVGDSVKQGQVLAQLDPVELEGQLQQTAAQKQIDQVQLQGAQTNYEQAMADYQRNNTLNNNGALSESELEQSRLKMNTAQSEIQAYQATLNRDQASANIINQQLSELTITSPMDGIVAARNIEAGEQISMQTTLFSIVSKNSLKVTVDVSDQMIANIKPGTTAKVVVPEIGKTVFEGSVANVSPTLDATSHSYPVKIQIEKTAAQLAPGMTAMVTFTGLKAQPGIIIPAQSVVETPQGSEVFTVEHNTAHMHLVQMGAVSSDQAVITNGLKVGQQLVINGQDLLSDGVAVKVVKNANQAGVNGMIVHAKRRTAK